VAIKLKTPRLVMQDLIFLFDYSKCTRLLLLIYGVCRLLYCIYSRLCRNPQSV